MNTDDYVHTNWPLVTSKKRSTRILEELLPVLKKKKKWIQAMQGVSCNGCLWSTV